MTKLSCEEKHVHKQVRFSEANGSLASMKCLGCVFSVNDLFCIGDLKLIEARFFNTFSQM